MDSYHKIPRKKIEATCILNPRNARGTHSVLFLLFIAK